MSVIEVYKIDSYGGIARSKKEAQLRVALEKNNMQLGVFLENSLDTLQARSDIDWDPQFVSAQLIALSSQESGRFAWLYPCLDDLTTSDYLWQVFLGQDTFDYEIRCRCAVFEKDTQVMGTMTTLDWKKELEKWFA